MKKCVFFLAALGAAGFLLGLPGAALAQELTLRAGRDCYRTGELVTVTLRMETISESIVGGQFFLAFDTTRLAYVSGDPVAPFVEYYEGLGAGTLDYAVNTPPSVPPITVTGDADLATFTFTALVDLCNDTGLITWRSHDPPTRLTQVGGLPVYPALIDLSIIDLTPPIVQNPDDVTIECDYPRIPDAWDDKMHFPQLPDREGWDVNATYPLVLADDWRCTESGPVRDIHFWGSWKHGLVGQVQYFALSIHANIPGPGYSRPGPPLWTFETFDFGVVPNDPPTQQGWYDPATGEWFYPDHNAYFRYDVVIPPGSEFIQQEGEIYWLNVSAFVVDPIATQWGWKSTDSHFMDDAVWGNSDTGPWEAMTEPPMFEQSMDLAFVITAGGPPPILGTATAEDNCDPNPLVTFTDVFTPNPTCPYTGTIARTWTATDYCGNFATCTQTITIVDTTPPVIICPPDVTVECDESTDPAATGAATATDNCDPLPVITFTDSITPGGCPDEYLITRTWTATDACLNAASCVQLITVVDDTPPAITCPPDLTIECDEAIGPANTGYATAVDNCDPNPVVLYFDNTYPGCFGWREDFEPYALGSQLHGQGWQGWDMVPAAGALVSGAQSLSAPQSVAITGASDLVHTYHGVNAGQWTYTAWQYIPTGFSGRTYFILLNTYNPGGPYNWSVQVHFDSSGVVHSEFDNAELPLVFGRWVELRVEIDFALDQQSFYYDGGLLYTKTWTGGVSGGGALNLAAVDLYANNASTVYYDDMSLVGTGAGAMDIQRLWTATDRCGNSSNCTQVITVADTTPPVVVCSPDITVNADPGCDGAIVTFADATATDNCDPAPVVLGCTPASGSLFPIGTTTVTCTARDRCGNVGTCTFDVIVTDRNELSVTVSLEPVVAVGPFTRCITFVLWDCDTTPPTSVVVEETLTFTNGVAGPVTIEVPCGEYDCITARDRLHTLRRTLDPLPIVGTQYVADFVAAGKPLILGNLNDDFWVDILDFGVFVSQWGSGLAVDTDCNTAFPHSDVSGDGLVWLEDFNFIQINFLRGHEPNCCGQAGISEGDRGPITRIAVAELPAIGMSAAAAGDLNGDGWLDIADVIAFYLGARPEAPPATAEPAGKVDAPSPMPARSIRRRL
ncbi:MAG: hypothetical protein AMXMBFR47_16540 [Planctomycetota bacterium]